MARGPAWLRSVDFRGATHYEGGRTSVDGADRDDRLSGSRVAATFALPVSPGNSIKVSASGGIYARNGSEFDGVGVVWQHVWQ